MRMLPDGYNSGDTIYVFFDTYGSNGESITITGLAVTDIEIYKNGSTTQRSSDNGYTLLDTDGIDFDGVTGLHGFSIDTSDNSDAGFWADGSHYVINVNSITVNGQTVRFSFGLRLGILARPTTPGRKLDISSGGEAGIDWANIGSPTTAVNLSGTIIGLVSNLDTPVYDAIGVYAADAVWDEDATSHQTQGTFGQAIGDPGATAVSIWSRVNSNLDATVSSRASQTSLDTVDDFLDTEIAAIKAKTDNLPSDPADASDISTAFATLNTKIDTIDDFLDTEIAAILAAVDTEVGAIKTVTDQLVAAQSEPSAVPAANATPLQKIAWLGALARNKITQTSTTQTLRNDADNANIATAAVSDDGTTFTKSEWA